MDFKETGFLEFSKQLGYIENDITLIVDKIAITKKYDNLFWQRINKQIEKQYERLRKLTAKWVVDEFPQIYQEMLNEQLTEIKYTQLTLLQQVKYDQFTNSNLNQQTIDKIMANTLQTFYKGYLKGEDNLKRLANYTQIINMSEKKIKDIIAEGITEKGTAQRSFKLLKDEMLKIAGDNKFITIINKNGKEIHYNPKAYAELVTRTKMQDANTQAVLNTASAIDADLVQFSMHNTECAICAPYEGKIFSLTGKDKDFPKIDNFPAFHPNCIHSLTIVFREGLKADGTLEKYIAFSNDRISKPPTNPAFIPVDKRELVA